MLLDYGAFDSISLSELKVVVPVVTMNVFIFFVILRVNFRVSLARMLTILRESVEPKW